MVICCPSACRYPAVSLTSAMTNTLLQITSTSLLCVVRSKALWTWLATNKDWLSCNIENPSKPDCIPTWYPHRLPWDDWHLPSIVCLLLRWGDLVWYWCITSILIPTTILVSVKGWVVDSFRYQISHRLGLGDCEPRHRPSSLCQVYQGHQVRLWCCCCILSQQSFAFANLSNLFFRNLPRRILRDTSLW